MPLLPVPPPPQWSTALSCHPAPSHAPATLRHLMHLPPCAISCTCHPLCTGMPVWYTPPPAMDELLPIILRLNQKRLPDAQQQPRQQRQQQQQQQQRPGQKAADSRSPPNLTSSWQLTDHGPPVATSAAEQSLAEAGIQQLLQFFGYSWCVHAGICMCVHVVI